MFSDILEIDPQKYFQDKAVRLRGRPTTTKNENKSLARSDRGLQSYTESWSLGLSPALPSSQPCGGNT
jgi:hypothetical protein